MSILDRLLGGASNDEESCCDMQIEEVDAEETDEGAPSENSARGGD